MIYHFDTLGSTNDEAQRDIYRHGDIVVAERQSSGRGQRGNRWISGEGLNLTLSAVIEPQAIEARRQFLILQASALAICDLLRSEGLDPRIKWTNDIYVGDRKIVGILIENRLAGDMLSRSIVGIGINVNERNFDPSLPNPTSMALEACREFDRQKLVEKLSESLMSRFEQLASAGEVSLASEYHQLIYRRDEFHRFRLPSGEEQVGQILGVRPSGELIVEWESGPRGEYLFGAIDFVIESRKR